jgi:hypothetical protein
VFWKKKKPASCRCGNEETQGYSPHAEADSDQIEHMCDSCMLTRLGDEFKAFTNRAILIEPSGDFPCYVFQPIQEISSISSRAFKDDATSLLSGIGEQCRKCGGPGRFLWLPSDGLTVETQERFFSDGISRVLDTSSGESLCAPCSIDLLQKYFPPLRFVEISAPKGQDGIQMPMGY